MLQLPTEAEEITELSIRKYVQSMYYHEKGMRRRWRTTIKRRHPDRFEMKVLSKMVEKR
jgi:hypothetical protein